MRMYVLEALMVFTAGYVIGKSKAKEKYEKAGQTAPTYKEGVHAEMKDGKIVLSFGDNA